MRWEAYGDKKANLNGNEENSQECTQAREEVDLPDQPSGSEVDEGSDGGDNDRGQNAVGCVLEQRGQRQQRDEDHDGHHDVGHGSEHSRIVVHG